VCCSPDPPVIRIVSADGIDFDTGLPGRSSSTREASSATGELANRRRLLSAALAVILLLVGGSYFVWRVMQRELRRGAPQTDFVSAVSHEFRTR
jgi:hypothetical protein